jgi:hypothetical protein
MALQPSITQVIFNDTQQQTRQQDNKTNNGDKTTLAFPQYPAFSLEE